MSEDKKKDASQPMSSPDTVDEMGKGRASKGGKPTLSRDQADRVRRHAAELCVRLFGDNRSRMAAAFGVSQPTVSGWINGDSSPEFANRETMAHMLGISESELRTGKPSPMDTLEVCLRYWPGRWSEAVVRKARERTSTSEHMLPDEWRVLIEQLAGSSKKL